MTQTTQTGGISAFILNDLIDALRAPEGATEAERDRRRRAIRTLFEGVAPDDALGQMLAGQAVAAFLGAIDCQRHAAAETERPRAERLYGRAVALFRTMQSAVKALAAMVRPADEQQAIRREEQPAAKPLQQPIRREKPAIPLPAHPVLDAMLKGLGAGGAKRDLLSGAAMMPLAAGAMPMR